MWLPNDERVQEDLELLQIDNIKKAMKAEQGDDWSKLKEDRSVTVWVVGTLKSCVRGAISNDANKFEVSRTLCGKVVIFFEKIIVSGAEARSLTMSYVCPRCGLFTIEDFICWVADEHWEKARRENRAIGGVQRAEDSTTGETQTGY